MKKLVSCVLMTGALLQAGVAETTEGKTEEVPVILQNTSNNIVGVLQGDAGTKESRDSAMRAAWGAATEKIARNILPGNPVRIGENGISGIVYPLNPLPQQDITNPLPQNDLNRIKWYAGIFTQNIDGLRSSINTGVVAIIPLGW